MTKVLLTNVNSVWGVIVNPQSSNTYRHAISFESEQMKKDYVSQELFNGTDFTTLFKDQPSIDFTVTSGSSAEFVITPTQYKNETMFSLLNKDFCIVQTGKAGEEKYLYYTLTGVRDGSTIKYTAELDIFFTYDIKDMFNEKETRIKQAQHDRYKLTKDDDGKDIIVPNLSNWDTPLYNKEDFDNIEDDSLFREDEPKFISWNDKINFVDGNHPLTEQDKKNVIEFIEKTKWYILFQNNVDGIAPFKTEDGESTKKDAPYRIFMFPDYSEALSAGTNAAFVVKSFPEVGYGRLTSEQMENPQILGNTLTLSGIPPFILNNEHIASNKCLTIQKDENKFISIKLDQTDTKIKDVINNKSIIHDVQADNSTILLELNPNKVSLPENIFNSDKFTGGKIAYDYSKILLDINNKKELNNEIKSHIAPYTYYKLSSSTKSGIKLLPQLFSENEFTLKANNGYIPENWYQFAKPTNYNKILSNSESIYELGDYLESANNYSLITDNNAFKDFMNQNKSQQNAAFINKGVSLGIGLLGLAASPFTGGASALAVGIGAASLAGKSASDINSQLAQRRDIKNEPNKLNSNGSTLSVDRHIKALKPYIQKYSLSPIDKLSVQQHFFKYGYNYNNLFYKINNLINTRYYFNYIEAHETFENIKLQASAEIKQIINDTLAKGLTIWHCRDLNTFKGIKNYDYENVEMSILDAVKQAKNDEQEVTSVKEK